MGKRLGGRGGKVERTVERRGIKGCGMGTEKAVNKAGEKVGDKAGDKEHPNPIRVPMKADVR